jgi:hypothetical protein
VKGGGHSSGSSGSRGNGNRVINVRPSSVVSLDDHSPGRGGRRAVAVAPTSSTATTLGRGSGSGGGGGSGRSFYAQSSQINAKVTSVRLHFLFSLFCVGDD